MRRGNGIAVRIATGDAVTPQIVDALARQRISVFRAFPYLYDGDPAYEARYLGAFAAIPGAAVVRPDDHPLRPGDYSPLDLFWIRRGYRKVDGLTCTFPWTDTGDSEETEKPMQVWMRAL